jgi:hypothetical protein
VAFHLPSSHIYLADIPPTLPVPCLFVSYEEYDLFEQVKATKWLIPFTRQLRSKLAREDGYYLSHAREHIISYGCRSLSQDLLNLVSFSHSSPLQHHAHNPAIAPLFSTDSYRRSYTWFDQRIGDAVDFYNVQYYNQGTYTTCETLVRKSDDVSPKTSILEVSDRKEKRGDRAWHSQLPKHRIHCPTCTLTLNS